MHATLLLLLLPDRTVWRAAPRTATEETESIASLEGLPCPAQLTRIGWMIQNGWSKQRTSPRTESSRNSVADDRMRPLWGLLGLLGLLGLWGGLLSLLVGFFLHSLLPCDFWGQST
jgi:hypothetical protein